MLLICNKLGLIGKEMFAVDGCKLGSNASKEWSGTKGELKKKQQKMERAVRYLVDKRQESDARAEADPVNEREQKQIDTLRKKVKKLKSWLKRTRRKSERAESPARAT